ncbi:MAG: hypothetical protein IJX94_05125 [Clostridia bacterium]|nr:hypothetical protein [Clostridia bacterium]
MAESVALPFFVPVFATVQGSVASCLALAQHPDGYRAILNQCTTVTCKRRTWEKISTPDVFISGVAPRNFKQLQTYTVSLRYASRFAGEVIKQMLNDGYYVNYTKIDDFYLPGKSWYGTRHMPHDGIICGYDEADKTYSVAAYDINWVFTLIRIPQDCLALGIEACLAEGEYGDLIGVKVKEVPIPLDLKQIGKRMKLHLDSSLEIYPPNQNGKAYGLVVYDYLMRYMEDLYEGRVSYEKMDWRVLRPIWEHKKCMLDRIRAVEEELGWTNTLSVAYEPLLEQADHLRMMYALHHRKRRDSVLPRIREGLARIKESETAILNEFVEQLENY